jgi:hypothetical protein
MLNGVLSSSQRSLRSSACGSRASDARPMRNGNLGIASPASGSVSADLWVSGWMVTSTAGPDAGAVGGFTESPADSSRAVR